MGENPAPCADPAPSGGNIAHRATLRFFPADGSEPFERYLEGDIFEGTIHPPPGNDKVVVMNESIHDVNDWADVVTFADVDDFDLFPATVDPMSEAAGEESCPFL